MKAIVTGMVVTYPVGGVAWDYLQYALALEQLGWDVYYLEDTGWEVYDPHQKLYGQDYRSGIEFLQRTLEQMSPKLARQWHVRGMDGTCYGIERSKFAAIVASADLFLNVSGGTLLRDEYMSCQNKVLIDSDPGWNHFVNFPKWDVNPGWQGSHGWRAHDHFFTYAELIGQPQCGLPTLGIQWFPTRPLVVLDQWRALPPAEKWTTIMTWNNFGKPIQHDGQTYGTKELEFVKVEQLPRSVSTTLEVAAGGTPPVDHWRCLGWGVVDSHGVSATADHYRRYIEQSRGEFSVAKNVYVATRSGWFSCRSVCYLAAGRPAILQDTGFSDLIPTGDGLLAFSNVDEAEAALNTVEQDYVRHSKAARRIAEEHFAGPVVLKQMLRQINLS